MSDAPPFLGYRRRVRVVPRPARVSAALEDDAHRFTVTLHHDGAIIHDVETSSPRYPWTTCPAAGTFLAERMRGVPLATAATREAPRDHCTHMYDLFILAAAHATDATDIVYDIRVADPVDGIADGEIDRNGRTLLRWRLGEQGDGDFRALEAWSRSLPDDLQEAARMLRRGIMVSGGRRMPPLGGTTAAALPFMAGACYTFQPDRMPIAGLLDNWRDFSNRSDALLADTPD